MKGILGRAAGASLIAACVIAALSSVTRVSPVHAGASEVVGTSLRIVDDAGRSVLSIRAEGDGVRLQFGNGLKGHIELDSDAHGAHLTLGHDSSGSQTELVAGHAGCRVKLGDPKRGLSCLLATDANGAMVGMKAPDTTATLTARNDGAVFTLDSGGGSAAAVTVVSTPLRSWWRIGAPNGRDGVVAHAEDAGCGLTLTDPGAGGESGDQAPSGRSEELVALTAAGGHGAVQVRTSGGQASAVITDTDDGGTLVLNRPSGRLAFAAGAYEAGGRLTIYGQEGKSAAEMKGWKGGGLVTLKGSWGGDALRLFAEETGGTMRLLTPSGRTGLGLDLGRHGGRCVVRNVGDGSLAILQAAASSGELRILRPDGAPLAVVGAPEGGRGSIVALSDGGGANGIQLQAFSDGARIVVLQDGKESFLPEED